jgi:hypothetical protein
MKKIMLIAIIAALGVFLVSGVALAAKPDPVPPVKECKERGKKTCPPPVVDTDGDGVYDDVDECDTQQGPASNNGCPVPPPADTDGDGLTDDLDRCPAEPGTSINQGCPDTDGDGVVDRLDQCPDTPGSTLADGCPLDADGDGYFAVADDCDYEPDFFSNDETGIAGCPTDIDNDTVFGANDLCPQLAGDPGNYGCPTSVEIWYSPVITPDTCTPGESYQPGESYHYEYYPYPWELTEEDIDTYDTAATSVTLVCWDPNNTPPEYGVE